MDNSVTYTRVDGTVLDLSRLTEPERRYFDLAANQYRRGVPWADFCQLAPSSQNPVIEQGRATARTVASPLFLALLDMEWRLGVRQGYLKWHSPIEDDPFADEWLTVAAAAARAGVTRAAVYQAAERGVVISQGDRPSVISARSLSGWTVNTVRQRAGFASPVKVSQVGRGTMPAGVSQVGRGKLRKGIPQVSG